MLEVRLLTKCYSGIPVVDRVSFIIRPGEILGYLGPNGAGKSNTENTCSRGEPLLKLKGKLGSFVQIRLPYFHFRGWAEAPMPVLLAFFASCGDILPGRHHRAPRESPWQGGATRRPRMPWPFENWVCSFIFLSDVSGSLRGQCSELCGSRSAAAVARYRLGAIDAGAAGRDWRNFSRLRSALR